MSTLKINLANFFAKQSCSAWQKNRIVRKLCRDTYRLIMETGAANYPYANSDFADWPESDGDSTRSSPIHATLSFVTAPATSPG